MRCVVLGGTGFIGAHLVTQLLLKGHEVTSFGKSIQTSQGNHIQGDWRDVAQLSTAIHGADVVYHLIWNSVPTTSSDDLYRDLQDNVLPSLKVFEICVELNVKKVIFCSTGGAIYGLTEKVPIHEEHPTHPIAPYGVTKLMVENYLRVFHAKENLPYLIVRPGNAYGVGQQTNGLQGAVARFVWCAKNHQPVTLYGDGTIVRDYILVNEVAEALALFAEYEGQEKVFNLGTGQGTSLQALIQMVEAEMNTRLLIHHQPARWFDTPINILDISRLKTALGWQPKVDLKTGLAQLVQQV